MNNEQVVEGLFWVVFGYCLSLVLIACGYLWLFWSTRHERQHLAQAQAELTQATKRTTRYLNQTNKQLKQFVKGAKDEEE